MSYVLIADRVWDGIASEVKTGVGVVVDGNRIAEIIPVEQIPASLERVELPDCTLIPGLIDSHVHYGETMGPAFLAAGVTTIRDVGNELNWILERREMNAKKPTSGPRIICCGHLLDGGAPFWRRMGRAHADEESLRASIREHVERGVDQIKLYAHMDIEMIRCAVDEAHIHGKFILSHLGISAEEAVKVGLDEFEHLAGCAVAWRSATPEEDDVAIDLFLKLGTVINPTFGVWDRFGRILERSLHHDERRFWAHPAMRDVWNRFPHRFDAPPRRKRFQEAMPHLKRFTQRAWERGATIGLGTDTPFPHLIPGFSIHDELASYVDAGIPPVEALRAATAVNAKMLGLENEVGQISPGFSADLVAVRGNPCDCIDDISNIALVIRAGERLHFDHLRATMSELSEVTPSDSLTNDLLDFVRDIEAEDPGIYPRPASVRFFAEEQRAKVLALGAVF